MVEETLGLVALALVVLAEVLVVAAPHLPIPHLAVVVDGAVAVLAEAASHTSDGRFSPITERR